MQKHLIDLKEAAFSKLVVDYVEEKESLNQFYKYSPKISSFKEVIEDKKVPLSQRQLLVDVLNDQLNKSHNSKDPQKENIALLKKENTFTVTTGHQLNLLTGPLYFIYKIVTTIKLSQQLKANYPDQNFVPAFWMASEDHDFKEISHIKLFGKNYQWNVEENENHDQALNYGVAGKITTANIPKLLEEIKSLTGETENAQAFYDLVTKAYSDFNNLADATRYIVNELFGEFGLVVLDPDDKKLKASFKGILEDDIFNHSNHKLVSETISKLEVNYKTQVQSREINVFYLQQGSRERIVKNPDGSFVVLNTDLRFTQAELRKEINDFPERFSPNVVLRPLYQEFTLPNLAMIGGGAEISYWLEYKTMFDFHKVNFPMLVLRNSFQFVEANTFNKIEKLGISLSDVFKETDLLIRELIERNMPEEINLEEEKANIENLYSAIAKKATVVDSTLTAAVEGEKQRVLKGLDTLHEKMVRAEKRKSETLVQQIKTIKEKIFPGGSLQERVENILPFYNQFGKGFIPMLLDESDPLRPGLIVLEN